MLTNSADTIERLARDIERQKILMQLSECKTLEDYEAFVDILKNQLEK